MLRRARDGDDPRGRADDDFAAETEQLPGGVFQVSIRGELDLHSASVLRDILEDLHERELRTLILSFADCTFIDSTGLQVVLQSTRGLDHGDVQLLLAEAKGSVLRVLEVTGVSNMVLIYPTVDQARSAAVG